MPNKDKEAMLAMLDKKKGKAEELDILDKDYSLITFVEDRLGHDIKYSVNNEKIRNELSFECSVEFSKGLENTVNWYLDNLNWVEAVLKDKYIEV